MSAEESANEVVKLGGVCSAFSKIFNTRSSEIATHCMQIFDCDNIEIILLKRRTKFMRKFTEGVFGDIFV